MKIYSPSCPHYDKDRGKYESGLAIYAKRKPLSGGRGVDVLNFNSPARVVGILGMHRSGTSCLTGSLQEAGLFLGECHTFSKHNWKGNRENQKFVDFDDLLLEANGGAWDRPPAEVIWSEEHIAMARELLAEYSEEPIFGFKDPRALLALSGWKALIPEIEFVGIFRHPNAVAGSLEKRNGMPREDALNLWYVYNSVLYSEYQRSPFPILDFDDAEDVLDEKIFRVAAEMGLPGRIGDEKFYTSDFINNSENSGPRLPWKISRLYKKLKKVSL